MPDESRFGKVEVVVLRAAARRHLIDVEAVRESCVLHSADYAV